MQIMMEYTTKESLTFCCQKKDVVGMFVGLDFLSVDCAIALPFDEIRGVSSTLHQKGKKLFLSCGKILSENELSIAEKRIEKVANVVDGFFFTDLGLGQILKRIKEKSAPNIEIWYASLTYLTNSFDFDLYASSFSGAILSNQISSSEVKHMIDNTTEPKTIELFNKTSIFYSRRKLLTNYFSFRNKDNNPYKKTYSLQEATRENLYPILEDSTGTHIYETGYSFLTSPWITTDQIAYGRIHGHYLKSKDYFQVINAYLDYNNNKKEDELIQSLKNLGLNQSGAYYFTLGLLKEKNHVTKA